MASDNGWVDDLATLEDCAREAELLLESIASIKGQIEYADAWKRRGAEPPDPVWVARARAALRHHQADLQRVNVRRGILRRQHVRVDTESRDRALLKLIREHYPEQFFAAVGMFEQTQKKETA